MVRGGQLSDRFVGTWRLVSFVARGADGREMAAYGTPPRGLLMYDEGGRMSVQIARSDRRLTESDAFHISLSPEEGGDPVEDYFAYFGRYTVDESAATVTHHVEAGSISGFDGTDQRRGFRLQGDRLMLATLPEPTDGSNVTYVAIWERLQRDRDA
jgi:hypothetical protein